MDLEDMVIGEDKVDSFGDRLVVVNNGASKGKGVTLGGTTKTTDEVHLSLSHGAIMKGLKSLG